MVEKMRSTVDGSVSNKIFIDAMPALLTRTMMPPQRLDVAHHVDGALVSDIGTIALRQRSFKPRGCGATA